MNKLESKIRKILGLLNREYGRPKRNKNTPPVDELVRTILSQNTSDTNSLRAFSVLKEKYSSWEQVLVADTGSLARLIYHAGLANIKAVRIKNVLSEIKRREGRIRLSRLIRMTSIQAMDYLTTLKGVGPKTASCILLFSLGKPVMPVDTHIFRVSKRLGVIGQKVDVRQAHAFLTKLVPKGLIYEFHLGIIMHGRRTCRAQNPRCGICVLYGLCIFKYKKRYLVDKKS